jgi:hypothetical protein
MITSSGQNIVTCISDLLTEFGFVNQFIGYSQVISTSNHNSVTDFHTINHSTLILSVITTISSYTHTITVTITHNYSAAFWIFFDWILLFRTLNWTLLDSRLSYSGTSYNSLAQTPQKAWFYHCVAQTTQKTHVTWSLSTAVVTSLHLYKLHRHKENTAAVLLAAYVVGIA